MLLYALLNSGGALLMKIGLDKLEIEGFEGIKINKELIKFLLKLLKSPIIMLGALLFISDFIIYQFALSLFDISTVKPLINLSIVFMILFGKIILKESISKKEWLGLFFLIGGAIIISLFPEASDVNYDLILIFVSGMIVLVLGFLIFIILRVINVNRESFFIALIASLYFAIGSIFNKVLLEILFSEIFLIIAILFVLSYGLAFLLITTSLYEDKLSIVGPIINLVSSTITIIFGVLLLNEEIIILFSGQAVFPQSFLKIFGIVLVAFGVILTYKKDIINLNTISNIERNNMQ